MLRIQLLPSGDFLDLFDDSVATVDLFSTIMNKDSELLGSYSYPFTLPMSDRNKRLFQSGHLITSSSRLRTWQARIWLGVSPWKTVQLEYCVKGGKFETNLFIDNGIINQQLKESTLLNIGVLFAESSWVTLDNRDAYLAYMKSTAAAAPGTYPMVFAPIRNEHFVPDVDSESWSDYPDVYFPQSKYINEWDATNQQFVVDVVGTGKRHLEAPLFYLTVIVKRVLKILGYTPIGNWLNDPDIQRLVMYTIKGINPGSYNKTNIFDLVSYMPNIALNEFFKSLRNKFSLVITFNESDKTCLIDTWKAVFTLNEPLDLRSYQEYGADDYTPETTGYTITERNEDKDELYKTENSSDPTTSQTTLVIGDGTTGVELAISSTHMITENAPNYGDGQVQWRVPHVDQLFDTDIKFLPLAKDTDFAENDKFELRLLYYHGMVKNQNGDLYPYASADNLNYLKQPISGFSLSLSADATTEELAKDFFTFCLNSRKLDVVYTLPAYTFMMISNNRPVLVRDKNNATVKCIIDKLAADLGHKSKVTAKATLYSLPLENNITGSAFVPVEDQPPVDNGPVFVKMRKDMPTIVNTNLGDTRIRGTQTIIYAQFFADAAGTIPKDVTNLLVVFQFERHDNLTDEFHTNPGSRLCSGTEAALTGQIFTTYMESHRVSGVTFETTISWDDVYSIIKTGDYNLVS
jgi:hypothetical protein